MSTIPLLRRRARARGFSHVGVTLEAAAIVGWFAVMVLGEKLVADSTAARRSAEDAAQQSVTRSGMSYCGDTSSVAAAQGQPAIQGGVSVVTDGALSVPDLGSTLDGLGIGSQATYSVYTDPLRATTSVATHDGVRAAGQVGSGSYGFEARRAIACLERSKDSATPSLAPYRSAIFQAKIAGYHP